MTTINDLDDSSIEHLFGFLWTTIDAMHFGSTTRRMRCILLRRLDIGIARLMEEQYDDSVISEYGMVVPSIAVHRGRFRVEDAPWLLRHGDPAFARLAVSWAIEGPSLEEMWHRVGITGYYLTLTHDRGLLARCARELVFGMLARYDSPEAYLGNMYPYLGLSEINRREASRIAEKLMSGSEDENLRAFIHIRERLDAKQLRHNYPMKLVMTECIVLALEPYLANRHSDVPVQVISQWPDLLSHHLRLSLIGKARYMVELAIVIADTIRSPYRLYPHTIEAPPHPLWATDNDWLEALPTLCGVLKLDARCSPSSGYLMQVVIVAMGFQGMDTETWVRRWVVYITAFIRAGLMNTDKMLLALRSHNSAAADPEPTGSMIIRVYCALLERGYVQVVKYGYLQSLLGMSVALSRVGLHDLMYEYYTAFVSPDTPSPTKTEISRYLELKCMLPEGSGGPSAGYRRLTEMLCGEWGGLSSTPPEADIPKIIQAYEQLYHPYFHLG